MANMEINKDIISIGNKVIPTRNVSQASLWEDGEAKRKRANQIVVGIAVMFASYFFRSDVGVAGVVVAIGAVIVIFSLLRKPKYELHLSTNGGNLSLLSSTDHAFMQRLLRVITEAISGQAQAVQYNVSVDAKTITEAPRITGNQGLVVIGDGNSTTQTISQGGIALSHIAELMQVLNGIQGSDEARVTLSEVRSLVASGKGKDQTSVARSKFIPQLGTVTGLTDNVWNLVAKIGGAIHA